MCAQMLFALQLLFNQRVFRGTGNGGSTFVYSLHLTLVFPLAFIHSARFCLDFLFGIYIAPRVTLGMDSSDGLGFGL